VSIVSLTRPVFLHESAATVTIQVGPPGAAGAAGGFGSGGTPAEPGIARAVYP
jgi:hypothetical protein